MTTVKMFTRVEIENALHLDILDAIGYEGCNDVAMHYFIEDPEDLADDSDMKKINEYLIQHGCKIDEEIWIDVTW